MTRVLSLVWYKVLPPMFGGQKGIADFSQYLGELLPLHVLCSENNEPTGKESFHVLPTLPINKLQFLNPTVQGQIAGYIRELGITHLLTEHCYYGLTGIRMARKLGVKLVVHSHNMEYLRFREMGKWWWPVLYQLEKKTHRAADLSLFKTEEDMKHAVSTFGLDISRCMVVPYGIFRDAAPTLQERVHANRELKKQYGLSPETKLLVFNGTLDYEPNAKALEHLVREILPELRSTSEEPFHLLVTGRIEQEEFHYLLHLHDPEYTYAGVVADTAPYFLGADVFLNPVTTGGGVKTKVIESLAYGTPVVSYATGAKGIDRGVAGQSLQIVEDGNITAFRDAVIQTWRTTRSIDPAFFTHYHWRGICALVAERMQKL